MRPAVGWGIRITVAALFLLLPSHQGEGRAEQTHTAHPPGVLLRRRPNPNIPSGPVAVLKSQLALTVDTGTSDQWHVLDASLSESLFGQRGLLKVEENQSSRDAKTKFYVEYFDREGRRCFALLFSPISRISVSKVTTGEGMLMKLVSGAEGLAPLTRPVSAHVSIVEAQQGSSNETNRAEVLVREPATIKSTSIGVNDRWNRVWLRSSELHQATGPLLDVALAQVDLDNRGRVDGLQTIGAASSAVESWLNDMLARTRFTPARLGGVPRSGSCLVLVRAAVSLRGIHDRYYLPRDCRWIARYLAMIGARGDLTPINVILLQPCESTHWKHPGRPGCFRYDGVGTEWSLGFSNE